MKKVILVGTIVLAVNSSFAGYITCDRTDTVNECNNVKILNKAIKQVDQTNKTEADYVNMVWFLLKSWLKNTNK